MMNSRRGLNSLQLWESLRNNIHTKDIFHGIYALDQLKGLEEVEPRLIIVNTDPSYKPGKHWLLFHFNTDGKSVDFFDSLGKMPQDYPKEIKHFLQRWCESIYCVPHRIQPVGSVLCGHYCLYYAYCKGLGESMDEILNHLPSPTWIRQCIPVLFQITDIKTDCQACQSF